MPKTVLIAGASSMIGQKLALALTASGYKVYAGYHNKPLSIGISNNIHPIKLDITSDASCQKAVTKITKLNHKIYAVINIVGISPSGPGSDFTSTDFLTILNTNTVGAFRLSRIALPVLSKSGRIINIGSLSGLISFPNFSLYSASKFALRALSTGLYHEWSARKRFVVHLAPGAIANKKNPAHSHQSARARIPLLNLLLPLTPQDKVVSTIIKTLEKEIPPAEVLIGADTKILNIINKLIPNSWWNKIQQVIWQKQQQSDSQPSR